MDLALRAPKELPFSIPTKVENCVLSYEHSFHNQVWAWNAKESSTAIYCVQQLYLLFFVHFC